MKSQKKVVNPFPFKIKKGDKWLQRDGTWNKSKLGAIGYTVRKLAQHHANETDGAEVVED